MSDNNKTSESNPKKLVTKDYGEFGKMEVIDISDELVNYDALAVFTKRD